MATTRSKGGSGAPAAPAEEAPPRTRAPRTRAPGDEISGVAAPASTTLAGIASEPAAKPAKAAKAPKAEAGKAEKAPKAEKEKAEKKRGGSKRETYAETAARRRKEKEVDQLQADLRAFAQARPGGWNHDDWVAFLAHLVERGHDVSDTDGIGSRLEQERLTVALGGMEGLGPKRVQSLVERFHTLWSLRHADAGEVAAVPGMNRALADRLATELRTRFPE